MGPFQANCAMAAAGCAAAVSISTAFAHRGCGDPPLPSPSGLDGFGGRADSIAVVTGNLDSAGSSIAGGDRRS
jgi:hypothetical protein